MDINQDNASAFLLEVYDAIQLVLSSGNIDDVARLVGVLDNAKREISEMCEQAKMTLADLMGSAPEFTSSNLFFEKKQGSQRKAWDHKGLAHLVAQRIVSMNVDIDTGEVLKNPSELIADAFEFAGVSYWRVKELQKIGVNADSYCEVSEGKTNIIVRTID